METMKYRGNSNTVMLLKWAKLRVTLGTRGLSSQKPRQTPLDYSYLTRKLTVTIDFQGGADPLGTFTHVPREAQADSTRGFFLI